MSLFDRIDENLPFVDFRKEEFTKEEMLEIIDAYLARKPCLDKDSGEFPHFCFIMARNYMADYRRVREKYGKKLTVDLSREKLTFYEVITLFTFVERASRHSGGYTPNDYDVWANLLSRLEEIRDELLADDSLG